MRTNLIRISGMLGLILGLTALITVSVFPTKNLFNAVLACLALILLLIFFVFHFETFKAFSKKRSTQLGLNSILMVILFIFIVVVFNLVARQYYFRIDLSSTSNYSIAPQTVNVVKKLNSEIQIIIFGQENKLTFRKAKELLEGYRHLNKNVVFSILDLDRTPLLAKEYGVNQYDSIVVKGERNPVVVQGINEETITNAIIKATRKGSKKIYFITGHGERDINSSSRDGMTKAASRLNSIGYDTYVLTLSTVASAPNDADLLIISGPKEKFTKEDITKLDSFRSQGGKIIALFDPGYDASAITGKVGINLGEGMIVDTASNLGGKDEKVPLISTYPDTSVTKGFKLSTFYPGVAPLMILGPEMLFEYFTIVTASPNSRLIKEGKVVDDKGKYIIAAAAGSKKGKDITMVFGDSDFVSNAFFDVAGNGNLFLNCINWTAEEGELISIAPKKDDFIPIYITPEQGKGIMYMSVIGIPVSIFGFGSLIWWRRRRL